jgi:two-component system, response regulator YesN
MRYLLKAAIFDDEYIVLQGLRTMIDWSRHGLELVGTASDGLAALELFRTHRPDIILTDIRMPGMDGLQVIEEVLNESPDALCIVFSGFNEYEYVKRAIKLGVTDYIEKPITIPKIEEAILKISKQISRNNQPREKETLNLMLAGDRSSLHFSVDKALRYIEEHYDQDLSLQDVAEHVGMNPAYFSFLFKEKMGLTYVKHLTQIRMEHAKSLIQQGLLIHEVSEKSGFYNYRHFTEVFKKYVGLTPGQYREKNR